MRESERTIFPRISITLSSKEIDNIFRRRLYELTEEWYIDGSKKDKTIFVLCHESEPHPHNGDTFRELEKPLTTPNMQIIRAAIELKELLDADRQRKDRC